MNEQSNVSNEPARAELSVERIRWKKIGEYIKDHLDVITIVGVILSAIFNFGCYVYSMGIFDFWNIPYIYITYNLGTILVRFVLAIGIGIVFFILSTLFMLRLGDRTENKPLRKSIFIYVIYFVELLVLIMLAWAMFLSHMTSLFETFLYIVYYPHVFFEQSITLCGLVYICFWAMGSMGCLLVYPENIRFSNEESRTKKFFIFALIAIGIIFCVTSIFYTVYKSGRTSAEREKKITIATIDEKEYIVIGKYEDLWIVKEFINDGNEWKINHSNYAFEDLEGISLQVRTISNDDSISNHLQETGYELPTGDIEDTEEEIIMLNFATWCNQNQGFMSAILTAVTLLLSTLTIFMTYRVGMMSYKKNLSLVPALYKREGVFYIDVTIINCGNATICLHSLSISNNENLNIGMAKDFGYVTLKPCDYICKTIELCDDLENIERNQMDLNGRIIITAHDVDGRRYESNKGFPVG